MTKKEIIFASLITFVAGGVLSAIAALFLILVGASHETAVIAFCGYLGGTAIIAFILTPLLNK